MDTFTGNLYKMGEDEWDLVIPSIEFRMTYNEATIKDILNKTLSPESKTDFPDDGCEYKFDVNKFDNQVLDAIDMGTFREVHAFNMVIATDMPEDPNRGREAEVRVEFDTTNMTEEQKNALFEIGKLFSDLGVGFDTGSGMCDEGMSTRDWEWDWSLSGPMKVNFVRWVDENPESRYDREDQEPIDEETQDLEEEIIKEAESFFDPVTKRGIQEHGPAYFDDSLPSMEKLEKITAITEEEFISSYGDPNKEWFNKLYSHFKNSAQAKGKFSKEEMGIVNFYSWAIKQNTDNIEAVAYKFSQKLIESGKWRGDD